MAAHRVLLGFGLVTAVAVIGEAIVRRHRTAANVAAAGFLLLASVAAMFTWPLIEWDQVGLREVTVGTSLRGLWFAGFDDSVRFVLIDEFEVTTATYGRLVVVHLVVLPVVAVAALAAWWRTSRSAV